RTVRDVVTDAAELALEDLGERELKNIVRPVQVFRIAPPTHVVAAAQVPAPAVPQKPSIAVLPFTNMSGDAEQEYFSDGMTEDLITDLSKVSALFVIARNSSFAYKGRAVKVQEIGRDLGVPFVLEGSIRKSGRETVAQARAMYRRAIELDPTYAVAHAGLAATGVSNYVSDWADDPDAELDQAERWARRALELDDSEPFAHMALGHVMLWRRDHDGALAEFRSMIALDPNFAQGYAATGLALMYAGRAAEALDPFALAMRHDPHYPSIVLHYVAQANFSLGNYGAAAKQLTNRIAPTPGTDSSRMMLAACYGHLGRAEEARAIWAELMKVNPEFSLAQRERVLPYKDPRDFARIAEGLAKAGLP